MRRFDPQHDRNVSTRWRDPDLLAYWKYEDNSIDEVAGYNGVWNTGSAQYTAGWGQAAKIDAGNADIQAAATIARCGDYDDLTFSFWHYPNNAAGANITCTRVALPITYNVLVVSQPTAPFVRARVYGQAGYYGVEPAAAGMAQVWNFICVTWIEASDTGVLYVGTDGGGIQNWALADPGGAGAWTGPRLKTADGFRLAGWPTNESWLDDLRYYRVAKDAAGVQALYDEGKTALGL